MSKKDLQLVVGLGNPGDAYEKTRHNAGFIAIDNIADSFSIRLNKNKFDTIFGTGFINAVKVILAKPTAFMNRSGPPLQKLAAYFKVPLKDILVIHDDIDLDLGRIIIKEKGGHGGHKGIKSIIDAFHRNDFARLRIGIGRPDMRSGVTDYVLGSFSCQEAEALQETIDRTRNAVAIILCKSVEAGMNKFNVKLCHK